MKRTPGTRVIAIESGDSQTETLRIYGYGVYEGDFEPPTGPMGATREEWDKVCLETVGHTQPFPSNPRIKLDDGKTVWGFECWWGPVDEFNRSVMAKYKVVQVDIDEARKNAGINA